LNKSIMRICSFMLTLVMALGMASVTTLAETERKTGEGAYGTPVIDGLVDDVWNTTSINPIMNCITTDKEEYIGWFKILWDEKNLYILAKVYAEGGIYQNAFQWEEDQVKFHIDEDCSRDTSFQTGDYQVVSNWEGYKSGVNYNSNNFQSKTSMFENGYYVEIAVPFKTITPKDGHKIGLEALVVTSIKLGMYVQQYLWNGDRNWIWNSPAGYGTITLRDNVTSFPEEPEFKGQAVNGGYAEPEVPITVEKVNDVTVNFDSKSGVYNIVHVNEYPSMEINEFANLIDATVKDGNTIIKDGVTIKYTANERLAEYKNDKYGDGHLMCEREAVMSDGKLYVPISSTVPTLAYHLQYDRFGKVLNLTSGTDYPETELVFYARDFGAIGDGVHDDGPAITNALYAAMATGRPSRVELDENKIYLIGERQDSMSYFTLQDVENLVWDGKNSTLLFERPTNSFIFISRCANVTVKNLHVDYKEFTTTQGRIIELEPETNSFLIEIDEGHPLPADDDWVNLIQTGSNGLGSTGGWWAGYLYDAEKPHIKRQRFDNYGTNHVWHVKDRIYKVQVDNSRGEYRFIEVGDRYCINSRFSAYDVTSDLYDGMPSMFFVHYSGDITFENFYLYGTLHLGGDIGMCWGRINFKNFNSVTKDGRLTATNSDTIHVWRCKAGITVEDSHFDSSFDDNINTKGQTAFIVSKIDDYTYQVSRDLNYAIGDELIFFDCNNHKDLGHAFVKDFTTINDNSATITVDRVIEGTLLTNETNRTQIWNIDSSSRGSIVRGTTFQNVRRFAYICRSANTMYEANKQIDCGAGVQAANEIFSNGSEAPFPSSFTHRNNYIEGDALGDGLYPLDVQSWRSLMGDSATIDGFLIEGNTFNIPADRTINLKAIQDLYMFNNTLICNEEMPQYTLPIAIMNCEIKMIDGVNFNYKTNLNAVVNIAGCKFDESNIKNITVNEGNTTKPYYVKQ